MKTLLNITGCTVLGLMLLLVGLPLAVGMLNADQNPCQNQVDPETGHCGLDQPCPCGGNYYAQIPDEAPHRNKCCSDDNMLTDCKMLCTVYCKRNHCHCKKGGVQMNPGEMWQPRDFKSSGDLDRKILNNRILDDSCSNRDQNPL